MQRTRTLALARVQTRLKVREQRRHRVYVAPLALWSCVNPVATRLGWIE